MLCHLHVLDDQHHFCASRCLPPFRVRERSPPSRGKSSARPAAEWKRWLALLSQHFRRAHFSRRICKVGGNGRFTGCSAVRDPMPREIDLNTVRVSSQISPEKQFVQLQRQVMLALESVPRVSNRRHYDWVLRLWLLKRLNSTLFL